MTDRIAKALDVASEFQGARDTIARIRKMLRELENDQTARRWRLTTTVALRWRRARHLTPGTILHLFSWVAKDSKWPYPVKGLHGSVKFVGLVEAAHGDKHYQFLRVCKSGRRHWSSAEIAVPVHWFCDPDIHADLISRSVDPAAHDLKVREDKLHD